MTTFQYNNNTKPAVPFFNMNAQPIISPPLFSKFGALAKDTFKKHFEYEHSLKVITEPGNHSIENGAILGKDNVLRGYLKYGYLFPKYGKFSADIYSDASSESKATMEFSKLTEGLKVRTIAASNAANKDLKPNTASLEFDYIINRIAVGGAVKTDGNNHKINASAAIAHNGVAVGGEVHLSAAPTVSLTEKNFGIQFQQNDYLCAIVTEKNASVLATHIYQKPQKDYALASSFRVDLKNYSERSLAVGGIFNCNPSTTVKVKAEIPTGNVSAHIAHKLADSKVLTHFSISSNFKNSSQLQAEKFGIGLTLGSF